MSTPKHARVGHRTRWARALIVTTTLVVAIGAASTPPATAALATTARARAATGPIWDHAVRGGPWGLAADSKGAVVPMQEGDVLSLDRNGRMQWQSHLGEDEVVESTPALDHSAVLVGGSKLVTALDRASGAQRWQQPFDDDVTSVALAGDLALAGDNAGTLAAFDAATGTRRWSVRFDGRLWTAPRVDRRAGVVVATWHGSTSSPVRVFDLATGALRWEAPTMGYTAAPVVHRGRVFLASGDGQYHARVQARSLATGALAWETTVPGSFEQGIQPAAAGNDLAVVDHFGVVTVLDVRRGRIRWQHALRHPLIDTQVLLTARRVVLTSFSGTVFVLARNSGHVIRELTARRLEGYPISIATTSWGGPPRLLLALRLDAPFRIELRPLP